MSNLEHKTTTPGPWPHRWAVALVCVVFPLIWVGGLVTTYDAGMAVPDWPGTYGYNLLAYPWTTWLAGPFDLFIEHGHRLLGATAGLIAIGLVVATFANDRRFSTRMLAFGALVLVILQGALGGARVLLDARQVALIHGCVGPLFFAYSACVAASFAPQFRLPKGGLQLRDSLVRAAVLGFGLAVLQLVLGAFLRHPADNGSPQLFRLVLLFHIVLALALFAHVLVLAWSTLKRVPTQPKISSTSRAMIALLAVQVGLGLATFIVKYGWPQWLGGEWFSPAFTVTAQGFWSSLIVTAHVANGSLILATLAVLSLRLACCASLSPVSRATSPETAVSGAPLACLTGWSVTLLGGTV